VATLAHNLDVRRSGVWQRYPGMTIYWIGDTSHQAEQSDHNPDSRGIVHAIDCMCTLAQGDEIVRWALADTRDLEYVIFNRTIWSRSSNFQPRAYTGSNPHVDHVHVSGKHGSTGENSATGTGYDTTAEQMSPKGMNEMTVPDRQAYITGIEVEQGLLYLADSVTVKKNDNVDPKMTSDVTIPNQLAAKLKTLEAKFDGLMTKEQATELLQAVKNLTLAVENSTGAAGNYDAVLTRKPE